MDYKNSVAIIKTKNGSTVGCHFISTYNYIKLNPKKFVYSTKPCKEFSIYENVGGKVIIETTDYLKHSNVEIKNEIIISNVIDIKILTEFNV